MCHFTDYDCFQGARLEAKAALRLLGRCKGTLRCSASISDVREGHFVVCCEDQVCGVCVLVFADWGIVFRVQDWKRRLRCACWGAARALCIAEHRSQRCVGDILLFEAGCVVHVI